MLKLYPIGTVVNVKEQEMNLMIVGYGGVNEKGDNFDYIGVPLPYGVIDKNEELKEQFPALKD